jgi:hypothetical protein
MNILNFFYDVVAILSVVEFIENESSPEWGCVVEKSNSFNSFAGRLIKGEKRHSDYF